MSMPAVYSVHRCVATLHDHDKSMATSVDIRSVVETPTAFIDYYY